LAEHTTLSTSSESHQDLFFIAPKKSVTSNGGINYETIFGREDPEEIEEQVTPSPMPRYNSYDTHVYQQETPDRVMQMRQNNSLEDNDDYHVQFNAPD
jgi:hypothetical protein